jgi:hypothetical protein
MALLVASWFGDNSREVYEAKRGLDAGLCNVTLPAHLCARGCPKVLPKCRISRIWDARVVADLLAVPAIRPADVLCK